MTTNEVLAQWLAGRSREQLERILELRSDVLRGLEVLDYGDLANRLVRGTSVSLAVQDLPAPPSQLLGVLVAVGAGATVERAAEVLDAAAAGSDPAAHRELVRRSVGILHDAALVWPGEGERLLVNPGVHEVLLSPLGLGRPVEALLAEVPIAELAEIVAGWGLTVPRRKPELVAAIRSHLADPVWLRRRLGSAPDAVALYLIDRAQEAAWRRLTPDSGLDEPDFDGYRVDLRDPEMRAINDTAAAWARANGLAYSSRGYPIAYYPSQILLPSETVLALVGAEYRAPFTPLPPPFSTAPVTERQVASSASSAITEFLAAGMGMLEALARTPLAPLKSGGIGARELAKVAKREGTAVGDVRVVLELTARLKLLGWHERGGVGTAPAFVEWRRRLPAERAADLLSTWFALGFVPLVDRDIEGHSWPALARGSGPFVTAAVRNLILSHLAQLDAGVGVSSATSMDAAVAWRLPVQIAMGIRFDVAETWTEAERLGVIAHGRLSEAGAALLAGDRPALVHALTSMLPGVQTTGLFGSDLTVVVPGTPAPAVVDLLDAVAVREGRGAASSWRLTPASVRRALDDGHDVADLEGRLRDLADGSLPQALEYLLRDVGRRYGHAQVRPTTAIVQSDDEALLAEIAVDRALAGLRLSRLAPTVLASGVSAPEVVAALRSAGYLPLELTRDGDRLVQLRAPLRIGSLGTDGCGAGDAEGDAGDADEALRAWAAEPVPAAAAAVQDRPVSPETRWTQAQVSETPAGAAARLIDEATSLVAQLGGPFDHEIQQRARWLSPDEVRWLGSAIEQGLPVGIRYRSGSGVESLGTVSELRLEQGHLLGWCHVREAPRRFVLANIREVTPAPSW